MKTKTFLLGVTAGLVGGLTAAILTAPQSGDQLRSNISRNTKIAKDNVNDLIQKTASLKVAVVQLKNEVKNNIPNIISDLKQSITKYSHEIEPGAIKLKQELEGLQNSIAKIEKNLDKINKK